MGNKIKINIDDLDVGVEDISHSVKIKSKDINFSKSDFIYNSLNKFSEFIDENKEDVKNKGREKIKYFDGKSEKVGDVFDLTRNLVDDVIYNSSSFFNWVKYVKNQDEGEEIYIKKKD